MTQLKKATRGGQVKTQVKPQPKARTGSRVSPTGVLFEELTTSEEWKSIVMMVFGPPGVGKTWFAGTASQIKRLSPVLFLDFDGGSRTVRGKPGFENITVWRVFQFEALNEVYSRLSDRQKYPFNTVVLDNLGEMYNMAMTYVMEQVLKENSDREEYVPSRREYGIVRGMVHKVIKYFSDLSEVGVNIIFTAHANLDRNELDHVTKIRPALAGKLSWEVPGNIPIVGYLATEDEFKPKQLGAGRDLKTGADITRALLVQPTGKAEVKDSSDKLGVVITNPTMPKIAKMIWGPEMWETKPVQQPKQPLKKRDDETNARH